MKTETSRYLRDNLYDLVYALNFKSEKDAELYNKEIVRILNEAEDLENDNI